MTELFLVGLNCFWGQLRNENSLYKLFISPKLTVVQFFVRQCAKQQHEQAQQVVKEAISMPQIRAQRAQRSQGVKQDQAEWLQVGLDGAGCPHASKKEAWRQDWGHCQSTRPGGQTRTTEAHEAALRSDVWAAEEVGTLSYAAACELAATEAKQQVMLGDGANWIKTQASEHFPDAVKILDWPHLQRKIRDAVRAVQPGKRPARRFWRKQQYKVLLWQGEREEVPTLLRSLRPTSREVPLPLEDAIR